MTCVYLQTQITVYDTQLVQNFDLDFATGDSHHVLGSGLDAREVEIERPFALTFVFQMGSPRDADRGVPWEGVTFPCEVRWLDADSGGSLSGLVYDSWYGPCYVGYGTHRQQGFIAEVRPPIVAGSLREDFRRWLWSTGHYRVELVMDPGTIHEYVISHRLFEIVDYDDPDENPFPAYLNEFSEIDPGCPDCTDCGCSSRYGCDCDADSDCGCECGGSCHCTSRCGSCDVWHWRGLGAVGSGRAPLVDRRHAGSYNWPRGANQYWGGPKTRVPTSFGISANVQMLVDQHYGLTTRCRDVKGKLTDSQVFVDDAKWGVDDITPGEAGRYSWLEAVAGGRTPLGAQEDVTGPGSTQYRSYADGVQARELLRRKRFAVCEDSFRRELFKDVRNQPTGGNFVWVSRLFEKVWRGDGCPQPTGYPDTTPVDAKDVWRPAPAVSRYTERYSDGGKLRVLGDDCPAADTGYHPPGKLDEPYDKGLLVVHWDPLGAGRQGKGVSGFGTSGVGLTCRGGGCNSRHRPARIVATGGIAAMLPSDGSACWFYDYGEPEKGWQTVQGHARQTGRLYNQSPEAVVELPSLDGYAAGGKHDETGLTQYGKRIPERFLGFVDSRPAPHMLVEWPSGVVGEGRSLVAGMIANVRSNFVMAIDTDDETDLCGDPYESVWAKETNGDEVKVRVRLCWMRYADAQLLPFVKRGGEWVPHTVEVMSASHPNLPSRLEQPKFAAYRLFHTDYYPKPIHRTSTEGSVAADDSFNKRSCRRDGYRCVDLASCPHLDHRGMLRTAFTLQSYPQAVRESEGNVSVVRLEDQHLRRFTHLLVYPSDPRARKGTNLHVLRPNTTDAQDDARLSHDRALKLNRTDFRVVNEAGSQVLYVNMPVIGPGTYGRHGRPAKVDEVRMPWVGYDRISGGDYDGWVRYTATDGQQAVLDPSLFVHCPDICPYLSEDPDTMGQQAIHGKSPGHGGGWYSKQAVVGLYPECSYEPPIGAISCGEVSLERAVGIKDKFQDLPFPYCPTPVVSGNVDLEQCNVRVRTDRVIRTMENYVVPPWTAGEGPVFDIWAEGRGCITGTAPSFGDQTISAPDKLDLYRPMAEIVLPQATGGEGPLTYHLVPPQLPPGIVRNGFVLSGTPTQPVNNSYIWLVKDADGDSDTIYFRLLTW